MRRVLWISAAFNLNAAAAIAFPASAAGQLAGLPASVPLLYRALLTMFVLLFAGAYAWLAREPTIHRPLVALAAIGKLAAFFVVLACWLAGAAAARGVFTGVGDLVLAGFYVSWLRRTAT